MKKTPIICDDVPRAFPPYPTAVKAAGFVFISGLRNGGLADAPATFDDLPDAGRGDAQGYPLVDTFEGHVTADSWAVHEHLEKVLEAAGTRGDQVLRQHIWQRDKRFFPNYEKTRMHWQKAPAPSSGLGVSDVSGPARHWIGVDAIAICPGENPTFGERRVMTAVDNTDLPSASHYSQAVSTGPLIFFAGHIPIKTAEPGMPLVNSYADVPEEGRFLSTGRSHPDSRHGPMASQSWYVYNEMRRTLAGQGVDMSDVVHVTVFLSDLRDFSTFHRIHTHFFPTDAPSLCVTGFDEVGHRGTRIEIEFTVLDKSAGLERDTTDWPCTAPFAAPAVSQAGPLCFFSGMLGLGDDGVLVGGVDALPEQGRKIVRPLEEKERRPGLAAQCWMAWHRLVEAAAAKSMSPHDLVNTRVYLSDAADLEIYEAVRRSFIDDDLPAFECVIVHGPGPVPDAAVQIEAVGVRQ